MPAADRIRYPVAGRNRWLVFWAAWFTFWGWWDLTRIWSPLRWPLYALMVLTFVAQTVFWVRVRHSTRVREAFREQALRFVEARTAGDAIRQSRVTSDERAYVHPIAGLVHPWPQPCGSFVSDGRSEICGWCDWPEDDHPPV